MFIEFRGKLPRVHPTAFVAPTAVLIGDVEIGEESSVWFGAVIRGDNGPIRIGARSNVQDNAVIHVGHDSQTIVGNDVTIGHCALMEDCVIEDGALIGSNSVVLNYARIGGRALIGAGSVVPSGAEIPPAVVVAGAPAKVRKALDGPAVTWVERAAPEYVALSRSYLRQGIGDPSAHEIIAHGDPLI
jgi:carbonic anhydrase/acetyltransferase-like protein (isoleucine patch superfamily)